MKAPNRLTYRILLVICFLFNLTLTSCEDQPLAFSTHKELLLRHNWLCINIIDEKQNETIACQALYYDFEENGQLTIVQANGNKHEGSWRLFNDNQYIEIGNNSFKIEFINHDMMRLAYGHLNFIYHTAD